MDFRISNDNEFIKKLLPLSVNENELLSDKILEDYKLECDEEDDQDVETYTPEVLPSKFSNDLPLLTPEELSIKVDENYSCFTIEEAKTIKTWRDLYISESTEIEKYSKYNLERINILRKAIYENNNDAIIQCGWIPGVEFDSENRVKASKLVREKMEISVNDLISGGSKFQNWVYDSDETIEDVFNRDESYIQEATTGKLYPVYVTLFSNDTTFGKMIRKVTGSPYSHATVSLDPSLNDMYSFSDIPYNHDSNTSAGFVRESIWSPMYQKNRYFTVFVTFTDKEGIDRFNEKLKVFKSNYTNYDYNDLGLVQYYFKMKNTKKHDETKKTKWFCSEFVSYMLYVSTGFDEFKNVLQSPDDLQYKEDMIELGQYTLKSFDEKDVIRKTNRARQEFLKRRANRKYTNESYEDIVFEDCILNENKNILLEAKKYKDYVKKEKDVNKYTQIIDWKYLYDEFVKLFKNTDPTVRFDLFEIIIRDYIVPLKLRADKTMDIIVAQLHKIYKLVVVPFGDIMAVDVPNRLIKAYKNAKTTAVTYPDFTVKTTDPIFESQLYNVLAQNNIPVIEFIKEDSDIVLEAKSFPVQFDYHGNLILKNIRRINFEQEYADSHRLLKSYGEDEAYELMKFELAKMQFFITLLEKKIYKKGKDKSVDELKVRARFLNDFKKYLHIVTDHEPEFNFSVYYEQSPFNDALIKIDKSTLKYGWRALKYLIK